MAQVTQDRPRRQLSDRSIKFWFIMPTMVLLILMNLFPLIYSLFLSFTEFSVISDTPPIWVGIQNYADILSDARVWKHFGVTGSYAIVSVGFQAIIGFALALLVRQKFKGSGIVTTLILVPMMLSPIVVGVFWKLMFNPSSGIFNYMIGSIDEIALLVLQVIIIAGLILLIVLKFRSSIIGIAIILILIIVSPFVVGAIWEWLHTPLSGIFEFFDNFSDPNTAPSWIGDPTLALFAIIIVDVWMWSPFVMLLCLAGLSAIPDYLYEAAAIDRASGWFVFRRITLPQVLPLLLIAVLFRTIEALKQFDIVMGVTGGGPGDATEMVSVRLYRLAFQGQFDTGTSSALAYLVLIVIIAVSNLYIRQLNKARGG